jgi:hypothetical protein
VFVISLLVTLVIIEDKQLKILENNSALSLIRDDKSCKIIASQQVQQTKEQLAKQENKQEITKET